MTAKHGAAAHHAAASVHHGQAMQFHREASRHYQIGKDYAHAAHQALVAHGHTMQAMEHGQKASEDYAEHGGNPLPKYLDRAFGATAVVVATSLSAAEHHAAAADHDGQAAVHHDQAAVHFADHQYARAAAEAQIAHSHAQHSVFHGNEAAKYHVGHHGRVAASANPE